MIPLFSTRQVREIDDYAINRLGIPGIVLMENASISIFNYLRDKFLELGNIEQIGIICGKGNNGGDGFAVARQLANDGYKISLIHLGSEKELSDDCRINFNILKNLSKENKNISIKKYSNLNDLNIFKKCDAVLDAMLGSGARGELKEPYKSIVEKLNKINTFKAAIDIPTGLDADLGYAGNSFKADLTITLGEFKKGLFFGDGYADCGDVLKGWIGVGSEYYNHFEVEDLLIEPEDALDGLSQKEKNLHKYSAGKVLTIAGSKALPGAAAMTSRSALKVGAGASILCFPDSARSLIQKKLDEVIVKPYKGSDFLTVENLKEINERIKWADVVALGPGLGRDEQTQEAVRKILKEKKFSGMVIDADAIFAIGKGKYKNYNLKNIVFTPHHAEFANLIGVKISVLKKDILRHGKSFALETGAYLVLKGAPTIIFNPDGEALINTTGNPGMAKFGTGDVLTGVLSGLIAQQKDLEKAIIAGVYIHSLACDLLMKEYTEFGYTAMNIINNLHNAIRFLRGSFA
jgi:ADP-dependent NAD(P)H-hydrate dehydratase / NAD(P)H-hydrate epimerase